MAKSIYSLYIPYYCHYLSKIQNRSLSSILKSLQWLLSTIRQRPSALGGNAYLSSLISSCFHLGHSANCQYWGDTVLAPSLLSPLCLCTHLLWRLESVFQRPPWGTTPQCQPHCPSSAHCRQLLRTHTLTLWLSLLASSPSQHPPLWASLGFPEGSLHRTGCTLLAPSCPPQQEINCTLKLTVGRT